MSTHTHDGVWDENELFNFPEFEREVGGYEEYALQPQAGDLERLGLSTTQYQALANALAALVSSNEIAQGSTTTTTITTLPTSSSTNTDAAPLPLSIATSDIFGTNNQLSADHPLDDQPPAPDPLDAASASTALVPQSHSPPKSPSKRRSTRRKEVLVQSTKVPNTPPVSKATAAPKDNGTLVTPQPKGATEAPKSKGKSRARNKRAMDDDEENIDTADSKRARRTRDDVAATGADNTASPQAPSIADTAITATSTRGKGKKGKGAGKRKAGDEAQPAASTSTEEIAIPPTTTDTTPSPADTITDAEQPTASKIEAAREKAIDSIPVAQSSSTAAPTREDDFTTGDEPDTSTINLDASAGPSDRQNPPHAYNPYAHLKADSWLTSQKAAEKDAWEKEHMLRRELEVRLLSAMAMASSTVPSAPGVKVPEKRKGIRGGSQKGSGQRLKKRQSGRASSISSTNNAKSIASTVSTPSATIQAPGSSALVVSFEQDELSNHDVQHPVHRDFAPKWLPLGQTARGGAIKYPPSASNVSSQPGQDSNGSEST